MLEQLFLLAALPNFVAWCACVQGHWMVCPWWNLSWRFTFDLMLLRYSGTRKRWWVTRTPPWWGNECSSCESVIVRGLLQNPFVQLPSSVWVCLPLAFHRESEQRKAIARSRLNTNGQLGPKLACWKIIRPQMFFYSIRKHAKPAPFKVLNTISIFKFA